MNGRTDGRTTGLRELDSIHNSHLSLQPITRLIASGGRGLVQIIKMFLNLASHKNVEHDQ